MTLFVLGVDPGVSGGYAVLTSHLEILHAGSLPTITTKKNGKTSTTLDGVALAKAFTEFPITHAFVEHVSSRPRQQGQFGFGLSTGIIHGVLYATDIPFQTLAPAVWKAGYNIKRGQDETKRDKKNEAREIAARIFPGHAKSFARVKDDGVAEAVLIAAYGLKTLIQPYPPKREMTL